MPEPRGTISNIGELVSVLSQDLPPGKTAWYRGHGIRDWQLRPSIFREGSHSTEMRRMKEFQQNATLLLDTRPQADYEWLFIMRHYMVSTRLLDWTESPLVGAYFTARRHPESDGALWVLLPFGLNVQQQVMLDDPESLPAFGKDEVMDNYTPEVFYKSRVHENLPIAFIAPRNTFRMRAQLSVFTISSNDTTIDSVGDGTHAWHYLIPRDAKARIMAELTLLGITGSQLFPELETIGTEVEGRLNG
jgi:FRG domain